MISQHRILIVDDHPICRNGVSKVVLDHFANKYSTLEAFDAPNALQIEAEEKPELIILDLQMPKISGLEFLKTLRAKSSFSKILIFSQSEDILLRKTLIDLKVNAIVSKASPMTALCDAISCVFRNKFYLDPALVRVDQQDENDRILTKRELEVVKLVSQGLTNKAVAEQLSCSDFTIKSHKSNIMRKIGVRNSAELVAWYFINQGKRL